MSTFDIFRFKFGNLPADERLRILRPEAYRLLGFIEGYSELISNQAEKTPSLELADWAAIIRYHSRDLREVIAALTAPNLREQSGLPELRPFDSLLEAIKHTASTLDLSLTQSLETGQLIIEHPYPLIISSPLPLQRKISLELAGSKYQVKLLSLVDEHHFEMDRELQLVNLEEVSNTIQKWLLED